MAISVQEADLLFPRIAEEWTPDNQGKFWLESSNRDAVLDFYTEFQKKSTEEQREADRAASSPKPSQLCKLIEESFEVFALGPDNITRLTAGQGPNKELASFLALNHIYAIANPLKLLRKAVDFEDVENIQAIAFFIVSNFNQHFSDPEARNKNVDDMFRHIMLELSTAEERAAAKEQAEAETFTPKDSTAERRQQKFAYAVATLVFKHTNHTQVQEQTLVRICAAARFDPSSQLGYSTATIVAMRLVHWIAQNVFGKTLNFFPVTAELERKIQVATAQRQQNIRRQRRLSQEGVQPQLEKAILPFEDLTNDRKAAEGRRQLHETRREIAIESAHAAPYTTVATKAIALAQLRGVDLRLLVPFIKAEKAKLEEIQRNNGAIDLQKDPFNRERIFTTRVRDIYPRVEALRAARLKVGELRENGKQDHALERTLMQIEDLINGLKANPISTLEIIVSAANKAGADLSVLEKYKLTEETSDASALEAAMNHFKALVDAGTPPPLELVNLNELVLKIKDHYGFAENDKEIEYQSVENPVVEDHTAIKDFFNQPQNPDVCCFDNFDIVRVDNRYFYVEHKQLGAGGYATVDRAFPYDLETGAINKQHPMSLKKIRVEIDPKNSSRVDPRQEAKIRRELKATRITRNAYRQVISNYRGQGPYHLLFLDYQPGVTLNSGQRSDGYLPPEAKQLSLTDRLLAVIDLLADMNTLHKNGVVHGDLNSGNLVLHVGDNAGRRRIGLSLIDNGESREVSTDPEHMSPVSEAVAAHRSIPPEFVNKKSCSVSFVDNAEANFNEDEKAAFSKGHILYRLIQKSDSADYRLLAYRQAGGKPMEIPIENVRGLKTLLQKGPRENARAINNAIHDFNKYASFIGLKTDIFSIVPSLALLLGARFPEKHRNDLYQQKQKSNPASNLAYHYAHIQYDLDGLLSDFGLPTEVVDLVETFINRMQSLDYNERPNSTEAIQFFVGLRNFILYNTFDSASPYNEKEDETVAEQFAELKKLATGKEFEVTEIARLDLGPATLTVDVHEPVSMSTPGRGNTRRLPPKQLIFSEPVDVTPPPTEHNGNNQQFITSGPIYS